jgi:hypothetical protein
MALSRQRILEIARDICDQFVDVYLNRRMRRMRLSTKAREKAGPTRNHGVRFGA